MSISSGTSYLASSSSTLATNTRSRMTTRSNVPLTVIVTSSYSALENHSTPVSSRSSQSVSSYYSSPIPLQTAGTSSIITPSTTTSISTVTMAFTSLPGPATLFTSVPSSQKRLRITLVASLSAAFILTVSVILAAIMIFIRRRHQNKHDILVIQKKNSRAQLLVGEDMNEVASPTASSGMGSFGHDVFGKVIGERDTRWDGGGAPYQDITYAYTPPSPLTPWDSPRDPRSLIEALHHPSRVQPSEAKQYMSQYLSRRAEVETGFSIKNGREPEATRVRPLAEPAQSASVVDLRLIVDKVLGGAKSYPSPGHVWSLVSGYSTYSMEEEGRRYS